MNKEKLILVPPRELPLFTRPVGPTIPISARFGARSIHWNWHPDDKGVWHEGVICDTCNEVFNISNPKSLCKCGKRNGLGWHKGVDFASPCGTIVFSPISGRVEAAGWENENNKSQGFGLRIRMSFQVGNQLWKLWLGHLSIIHVKAGDSINENVHIADTGDTGHATGPHLHMEVRSPNNQQTNFLFKESKK